MRSLHLSFLQIWLTGPLPESRFVFATRSQDLIVIDWVVSRNGRQSERLVVHHFEVELFNGFELFQVVEGDNRIGLDRFTEQSHALFVLHWQSDPVLEVLEVKVEVELHSIDVRRISILRTIELVV